MPRIFCNLPNASESINGIVFEPVDGGMLSVEVDDEVAENFASIPGYRIADTGSLDDVIRGGILKLEPGNEKHWTKGGKPEVTAINAVIGKNITASDRDRVWAAMNE